MIYEITVLIQRNSQTQAVRVISVYGDFPLFLQIVKTFDAPSRRPSFNKLVSPRRKGGANLPNVRVYNLAHLLYRARLVMFPIPLFKLDSEMVIPYSLGVLLHSKLNQITTNHQHNLLVKETIISWRETCKKLGLSPIMEICKFCI